MVFIPPNDVTSSVSRSMLLTSRLEKGVTISSSDHDDSLLRSKQSSIRQKESSSQSQKISKQDTMSRDNILEEETKNTQHKVEKNERMLTLGIDLEVIEERKPGTNPFQTTSMPPLYMEPWTARKNIPLKNEDSAIMEIGVLNDIEKYLGGNHSKNLEITSHEFTTKQNLQNIEDLVPPTNTKISTKFIPPTTKLHSSIMMPIHRLDASVVMPSSMDLDTHHIGEGIKTSQEFTTSSMEVQSSTLMPTNRLETCTDVDMPSRVDLATNHDDIPLRVEKSTLTERESFSESIEICKDDGKSRDGATHEIVHMKYKVEGLATNERVVALDVDLEVEKEMQQRIEPSQRESMAMSLIHMDPLIVGDCNLTKNQGITTMEEGSLQASKQYPSGNYSERLEDVSNMKKNKDHRISEGLILPKDVDISDEFIPKIMDLYNATTMPRNIMETNIIMPSSSDLLTHHGGSSFGAEQSISEEKKKISRSKGMQKSETRTRDKATYMQESEDLQQKVEILGKKEMLITSSIDFPQEKKKQQRTTPLERVKMKPLHEDNFFDGEIAPQKYQDKTTMEGQVLNASKEYLDKKNSQRLEGTPYFNTKGKHHLVESVEPNQDDEISKDFTTTSVDLYGATVIPTTRLKTYQSNLIDKEKLFHSRVSKIPNSNISSRQYHEPQESQNTQQKVESLTTKENVVALGMEVEIVKEKKQKLEPFEISRIPPFHVDLLIGGEIAPMENLSKTTMEESVMPISRDRINGESSKSLEDTFELNTKEKHQIVEGMILDEGSKISTEFPTTSASIHDVIMIPTNRLETDFIMRSIMDLDEHHDDSLLIAQQSTFGKKEERTIDSKNVKNHNIGKRLEQGIPQKSENTQQNLESLISNEKMMILEMNVKSHKEMEPRIGPFQTNRKSSIHMDSLIDGDNNLMEKFGKVIIEKDVLQVSREDLEQKTPKRLKEISEYIRKETQGNMLSKGKEISREFATTDSDMDSTTMIPMTILERDITTPLKMDIFENHHGSSLGDQKNIIVHKESLFDPKAREMHKIDATSRETKPSINPLQIDRKTSLQMDSLIVGENAPFETQGKTKLEENIFQVLRDDHEEIYQKSLSGIFYLNYEKKHERIEEAVLGEGLKISNESIETSTSSPSGIITPKIRLEKDIVELHNMDLAIENDGSPLKFQQNTIGGKERSSEILPVERENINDKAKDLEMVEEMKPRIGLTRIGGRNPFYVDPFIGTKNAPNENQAKSTMEESVLRVSKEDLTEKSPKSIEGIFEVNTKNLHERIKDALLCGDLEVSKDITSQNADFHDATVISITKLEPSINMTSSMYSSKYHDFSPLTTQQRNTMDKESIFEPEVQKLQHINIRSREYIPHESQNTQKKGKSLTTKESVIALDTEVEIVQERRQKMEPLKIARRHQLDGDPWIGRESPPMENPSKTTMEENVMPISRDKLGGESSKSFEDTIDLNTKEKRQRVEGMILDGGPKISTEFVTTNRLETDVIMTSIVDLNKQHDESPLVTQQSAIKEKEKGMSDSKATNIHKTTKILQQDDPKKIESIQIFFESLMSKERMKISEMDSQNYEEIKPRTGPFQIDSKSSLHMYPFIDGDNMLTKNRGEVIIEEDVLQVSREDLEQNTVKKLKEILEPHNEKRHEKTQGNVRGKEKEILREFSTINADVNNATTTPSSKLETNAYIASSYVDSLLKDKENPMREKESLLNFKVKKLEEIGTTSIEHVLKENKDMEQKVENLKTKTSIMIMDMEPKIIQEVMPRKDPFQISVRISSQMDPFISRNNALLENQEKASIEEDMLKVSTNLEVNSSKSSKGIFELSTIQKHERIGAVVHEALEISREFPLASTRIHNTEMALESDLMDEKKPRGEDFQRAMITSWNMDPLIVGENSPLKDHNISSIQQSFLQVSKENLEDNCSKSLEGSFQQNSNKKQESIEELVLDEDAQISREFFQATTTQGSKLEISLPMPSNMHIASEIDRNPLATQQNSFKENEMPSTSTKIQKNDIRSRESGSRDKDHMPYNIESLEKNDKNFILGMDFRVDKEMKPVRDPFQRDKMIQMHLGPLIFEEDASLKSETNWKTTMEKGVLLVSNQQLQEKNLKNLEDISELEKERNQELEVLMPNEGVKISREFTREIEGVLDTNTTSISISSETIRKISLSQSLETDLNMNTRKSGERKVGNKDLKISSFSEGSLSKNSRFEKDSKGVEHRKKIDSPTLRTRSMSLRLPDLASDKNIIPMKYPGMNATEMVMNRLIGKEAEESVSKGSKSIGQKKGLGKNLYNGASTSINSSWLDLAIHTYGTSLKSQHMTLKKKRDIQSPIKATKGAIRKDSKVIRQKKDINSLTMKASSVTPLWLDLATNEYSLALKPSCNKIREEKATQSRTQSASKISKDIQEMKKKNIPSMSIAMKDNNETSLWLDLATNRYMKSKERNMSKLETSKIEVDIEQGLKSRNGNSKTTNVSSSKVNFVGANVSTLGVHVVTHKDMTFLNLEKGHIVEKNMTPFTTNSVEEDLIRDSRDSSDHKKERKSIEKGHIVEKNMTPFIAISVEEDLIRDSRDSSDHKKERKSIDENVEIMREMEFGPEKNEHAQLEEATILNYHMRRDLTSLESSIESPLNVDLDGVSNLTPSNLGGTKEGLLYPKEKITIIEEEIEKVFDGTYGRNSPVTLNDTLGLKYERSEYLRKDMETNKHEDAETSHLTTFITNVEIDDQEGIPLRSHGKQSKKIEKSLQSNNEIIEEDVAKGLRIINKKGKEIYLENMGETNKEQPQVNTNLVTTNDSISSSGNLVITEGVELLSVGLQDPHMNAFKFQVNQGELINISSRFKGEIAKIGNENLLLIHEGTKIANKDTSLRVDEGNKRTRIDLMESLPQAPSSDVVEHQNYGNMKVEGKCEMGAKRMMLHDDFDGAESKNILGVEIVVGETSSSLSKETRFIRVTKGEASTQVYQTSTSNISNDIRSKSIEENDPRNMNMQPLSKITTSNMDLETPRRLTRMYVAPHIFDVEVLPDSSDVEYAAREGRSLSLNLGVGQNLLPKLGSVRQSRFLEQRTYEELDSEIARGDPLTIGSLEPHDGTLDPIKGIALESTPINWNPDSSTSNDSGGVTTWIVGLQNAVKTFFRASLDTSGISQLSTYLENVGVGLDSGEGVRSSSSIDLDASEGKSLSSIDLDNIEGAASSSMDSSIDTMMVNPSLDISHNKGSATPLLLGSLGARRSMVLAPSTISELGSIPLALEMEAIPITTITPSISDVVTPHISQDETTTTKSTSSWYNVKPNYGMNPSSSNMETSIIDMTYVEGVPLSSSGLELETRLDGTSILNMDSNLKTPLTTVELQTLARPVTPLTLGLETAGGVMTVIIPRNTVVPTKKKQLVSTYVDNQTEVLVQIYEGERLWVTDNNLLGSFELAGIPPAPRGMAKITVFFDVDAKGILNVSAEGKTNGELNRIIITNVNERPNKQKIDKMIQDAQNYKIEDEENRKKIQCKNNLENYVYKMRSTIQSNKISKLLDQDDKKKMTNAVEATINWLLLNNWLLYNRKELANIEDFNKKRSELHNICSPILAKISEIQKSDVESSSNSSPPPPRWRL